jgi:phage terminase large subunit
LCVIGFYVTEKTEEKQIISNDIEMKLTVTGYNRDNKAMMCSHLSIEQTMAQNPKLLHEKLSNLKQLHKFDYCHYQIMEYGEIIETGYDFISPREESEV